MFVESMMNRVLKKLISEFSMVFVDRKRARKAVKRHGFYTDAYGVVAIGKACCVPCQRNDYGPTPRALLTTYRTQRSNASVTSRTQKREEHRSICQHRAHIV
jgi:hypothetical protein